MYHIPAMLGGKYFQSSFVLINSVLHLESASVIYAFNLVHYCPALCLKTLNVLKLSLSEASVFSSEKSSKCCLY